MVSRVLADRYEISQQLGRNAGRRTFLARDLQTQQRLIPPKRILLVDGPERESELFPDRLGLLPRHPGYKKPGFYQR